MWAAIRYVERNPVRARMVRKAERYPWSSAAAHCGLTQDEVLSTQARWWRLHNQMDDWSAWLAQGDETSELELIRRNIEKVLPCGSERFIKKLEALVGCCLRFQPQGRPKHENKG